MSDALVVFSTHYPAEEPLVTWGDVIRSLGPQRGGGGGVVIEPQAPTVQKSFVRRKQPMDLLCRKLSSEGQSEGILGQRQRTRLLARG